jgi:hypothetical protein
MITIDSSIFAFATDLQDEGFDTVLDNVGGRAGVGGITLAAAYHHGRDIFPHNPVGKVRFLEGGTVFFRPEQHRYDSLRVKPQVSSIAQEMDVLDELMRAAERRSMRVNAWAVFLHNFTLGTRFPDCVTRNAFGDPYLTDLCPANPDVRAYARALGGDIARYGVHTIVAESLHYHPLEHGFHHERYFIKLGARASYLLGLCFCEHCQEAARHRGVDAAGVRAAARREIERVFEGEPEDGGDVARDDVAALAGGEMEGYLEARAETVASLAAELSEALEGTDTRLGFLDPSGATKGYATGRPTGGTSASIAWRFGIDLDHVARCCDELEAVGYAADPERLRLDLGAYGRAARDGSGLAAALRPMAPDCDCADNLAQKIRLARDLELRRVDFYHYGFMRLGSLDWIKEALAAG